MNTFIRKSLVGALLSVGLMGASQALTLETGANLGGSTTLTFTLASNAPASFGAYLTIGGTQVAPDSFAIFSTTQTPTISGTANAKKISFASGLAAGTYTLELTTAAIGGTYTFTGSNNLTSPLFTIVSASPVPEPTAIALALAGVGVLGFLGRRRQA